MTLRVAFFLTIALLIPTLAVGQAETTARVSGRVVDEDAKPIVGARVTLVSSALQGQRTTETDADGQFFAALLPAGPYAISVTAPGKQTVQVSLRLTVGQTVPLEVTLKQGEGLEEKVTVYGAATPLETTVVGENFNYDTEVEELPIASRSVNNVAFYSPNVRPSGWAPALLVGVTSGVAITGAPSYSTVALLDGADITEPAYGGGVSLYLEDAVEEIQVLTTGISARYGRFQGGALNVTTKSGGNEFDGTVRAEFANQSWNSKTPFGEEQSSDLNQVYQATLGGPILGDKLWFFAGARVVPSNAVSSTTLVTGESYEVERDDERFQLKLRGAPAPGHIVEVGYLDRDYVANGFDFLAGDILVADSVRVEEPMSLFSLRYQGVLGPRSFLDVVVSSKNHSTRCCSDGTLRTPFIEGSTSIWFNNFRGGGKDWMRDNETASASFTHVLSGSGPGSHTFEAGVQYLESTTDVADILSPTGFFLVAIPLGSTPFAEQGPAAGEVVYNLNNNDMLVLRDESVDLTDAPSAVENVAAYVQDSWQFGKWRLDAGLRWDRYEISTTRVDVDRDLDALSPRLGVTRWISDAWQVQATWGRYTNLPPGFLFYVGSGNGRTTVTRLYTGPALQGLTSDQVETVLDDDAQWGVLTNVADPDQPTTFLADDFELPRADEFTLGVRAALPRNTGSFTLTYVDRDYKRQIDDFVGDLGTTTISDPVTGETLPPFDNTVWANASTADRRYQAIVATWDYRPGVRWDIGGNWTYSELTGNWEGNDPNNSHFNGTPIGNYERSRPEAAAVPQGDLYDDTPHRIQAWGNYRFDLKRAGSLVLGGIARFQSGSNWSRTAQVPLADDPAYNIPPASTYEHFFDGRGNNTFDDGWAIDLSARWQVQIYKRLDVWLKATVVNIFDNDALITYDTSGFAVDDGEGNLSWEPVGNCGPGDSPSTQCTGFGAIRSQGYYQTPRAYLFTLGLAF